MNHKPTSKKENLFAASRFVLPEHRELYLRIKEEEARYRPPDLDEEQQAELSEQVTAAFQQQVRVRLTYYDGRTARQCRGHVVHLDQAARRIKLRSDEQVIWIPFVAVLELRFE
ncbi:YolD-like family protein [Brevibacillus fulvus]|uniref:YolD-like family protein n=1 Tax=Brevibacillus fulvus TaxID=1125967 RepID=A0A938Y0P2_9BACL|nr:YolD-like family protein [Brevibacillus fulvus]MBM7589422.1 hypothetical protein [Brevibacillus fulvus]